MNRFLLSVVVLQFTFAGVVMAQESIDAPLNAPVNSPLTIKRAPVVSAISAGEVAATPDMWFYEQQLRRYEDPRNAVRAAAEIRTAQRQNRMAAMKWFGFSNSRPTANFDPVHGNYSPRWVSNGNMPSQWQGGGSTTIIDTDSPRRY